MTGVGVVRNRRLLVRAAVANYACVPIVAVGLLLWFGSFRLLSGPRPRRRLGHSSLWPPHFKCEQSL
jgi:hypothetical protein